MFRITSVIFIKGIICFDFSQATSMAELNLKSFTRIPNLTYKVRANRFRNYISIRAYRIIRIILTTPTEATIGFDRLWYIAKTSLNKLKSFTATVLTLNYTVQIDRFRNYINIRAHWTTRIVLTTFIEAIVSFNHLQYIAKTGLNKLKSFTATVPTPTYVFKIDRFRNYISIGAHGIIRIVLVISVGVIICFYHLWYIIETGLNILKSFTITALTLTYIIKIDRFRNYTNIGACSITKITLVIFTEAIIYFDFL